MKRSVGLLFVAAISLVGCKHDSVVGDWSGQVKGMDTEIHYDASNRFDATAHLSIMGRTIDIKTSGTYKVDGEKLTMTTTSVELPSALGAVAPKQALEQAKGTKDYTVKFTSQNELTLSQGGESISLQRKKA